MKLSVGIAAACLLLGFAKPSHAVQLPLAGIYAESRYIESATPADGATCILPHENYSSVLTYPGPIKAGGKRRVLLTEAGGIRVWSYPMTPAAAATTWSGNVKLTTSPSDTTADGTFSYSLTYVDQDSWIESGTEVIPSTNGTGTCTYTVDDELIRAGAR